MTESAADRVLGYVRREKLVPGDRLPAEVAIAQVLGLSRNSVREAYADLIAKGMITRRHGVGTFIAEPPLMNTPGGPVGFWRLIEQARMTPSLEEISRGEARAPGEFESLLALPPGGRAGRLRWLFRANGDPCILIDHYLPPRIPLSAFDPSRSHSALSALGPYVRAEGATLTSRISATNAPAGIAGLLGVTVGEALLCGTAVVRSGDGIAVLASRSWMVPSLFNSQQVMSLSPLHFHDPAAPFQQENNP